MSLVRVRYDIPASHGERFELACDLCGEKAETDYGYRGSRVRWPCGNYGVEETVVLQESGVRYPDCRSTETMEFHICPDCFRKKLMPWLVSQGASATHEEHDS